jgi:hypothetical protein
VKYLIYLWPAVILAMAGVWLWTIRDRLTPELTLSAGGLLLLIVLVSAFGLANRR